MIGFLSRIVAWFNTQGIDWSRVMTGNCPVYVSKGFAHACKAMGLRTSAAGPTHPAPMTRPKGSFRGSAEGGLTGCRPRTPMNGTAGCTATPRSITASGSTHPWAGVHLSSGSPSCSADEPCRTQRLAF